MNVKKFCSLIKEKKFIKAIMNHQVAAGTEHLSVFRELSQKKIRTIVDIGANRGQFALVARNNFPDAVIFSFEPLAKAANIFKKLFLKDSRVILNEFALGPETREMKIHISNADDSSSLLPISQLQNSLYKGTFEKATTTVQVKPLDEVLNPSDIIQPAFLKIDVQGYEKEVLLGCSSLLHLFQFVYVECSFVELYEGQSLAHEVIEFLSQSGFILSGVYNMSYDKKGLAIQGDFLFTRKS
jgi:FkbM family methyltransferase